MAETSRSNKLGASKVHYLHTTDLLGALYFFQKIANFEKVFCTTRFMYFSVFSFKRAARINNSFKLCFAELQALWVGGRKIS